MRDKELHIFHVKDIKDMHLILIEFINEADEVSASYVIDLEAKKITDEQNNELIDLDAMYLVVGGIELRSKFISFNSKFNEIRRLI